MRLRPHHLLCTQTYRGKGYDNDFVDNMTAITNRLGREAGAQIEIVFSTDDICVKCPKMTGEDLCEENAKVKAIDRKVVEYFGLEEKCYIYQNIIREIKAKMTASIMDDICGDCNWYKVSDCRSIILGRSNPE